jgi:alpha-glucosidase
MADQQNIRRWPEGAVVYQIYPRSFQDSNGDGVGDLPGIISRLDYIQGLGVTALWLSPFYPSPMADFGYDVADYCNVDPVFGTLDDFKQLVTECEGRGLKLIVDLVPNHTSDQHEWFRQSRQSADNPYADWYIWRPPHEGSTSGKPQPPNNWLDALTGQPAWEWDPQREQFYLHSFETRQPDLNWANPAVREAMKEVMRFWLHLGVDGFRVDAVYWLGKEPLFSDDTPNPNYAVGKDLLSDAVLHDHSRGWPSVYAYLTEMAAVLKEPTFQTKHRFMVTEGYPDQHNHVAAYVAFYAGTDPQVTAPFNFEGLSLPWKATSWRRFLKVFHQALEHVGPRCIASYVLGNHDKPRLASRLGDDPARAAAVMLLTLPGMVFVYYGEELGMHDVHIPPELVQDPEARGDPKHGQGRDPHRTPMQWDATAGAGFSTGTPWLPLAPDYAEHSVEHEGTDPASFLSLYRRLGQVRKDSEALRHGAITVIDTNHPDVLGYTRMFEDEGCVVLINFSDQPATCQQSVGLGEVIVSSVVQSRRSAAADGEAREITLLPYEAVVFSLDPERQPE